MPPTNTPPTVVIVSIGLPKVEPTFFEKPENGDDFLILLTFSKFDYFLFALDSCNELLFSLFLVILILDNFLVLSTNILLIFVTVILSFFILFAVIIHQPLTLYHEFLV